MSLTTAEVTVGASPSANFTGAPNASASTDRSIWVSAAMEGYLPAKATMQSACARPSTNNSLSGLPMSSMPNEVGDGHGQPGVRIEYLLQPLARTEIHASR